MPRKSKLLPFLQRKGDQTLRYVRRVPAELQKYLGNRRYITRVLNTSSTDVKDKEVVKAWSQINEEIEEQLKEAQRQFEKDSEKGEPVELLSARDTAGIAAEPWRILAKAAELGRGDERLGDMLVETLKLYIEKPQDGQRQLADVWLSAVLKDLQIAPTEEAMSKIRQRFAQYGEMAFADQVRKQAGDFSTPEIESKAPALPARRVTYQQLLDAWLTDAGGIREIDGVGVGKKQHEQYETNIAELIRITELHYPAELSVSDVRKYLMHLQNTSLATTTKQLRMSMLTNLFAIGVRVGLLEANPFVGMAITAPRAERKRSYRPFARQEIIDIFNKVNTFSREQKSILPLTLLMTGARAGDILFLRHSDVAQTKDGVWYFKMLDRPTDEYPRTLKGAETDERFTPMHPLLIERGFLALVDPSKHGYIFENRNNDSISAWFKRILQGIGIWERKVTVLHSLRGTAIDAWREARVPEDVRRALTAHSSKDVQERTYGEGLQFMPDILYKELTKVDWSWIP